MGGGAIAHGGAVKKKEKITLAVVIVLFTILFLIRGSTSHQHPFSFSVIGRSVPGFNAPSFFDKNTILNRNIFMDHISILNIFSTSCLSCAIDKNELARLKKNEKQLLLVGIAYRDHRAAIKNYLQGNNPYHLVIDDESGEITHDFGVNQVPVTLLIDKRGVIRAEIKGPLTASIAQKQLQPLIHKLQKAW